MRLNRPKLGHHGPFAFRSGTVQAGKGVHSFQKKRVPLSLGPILEVIWGMSVKTIATINFKGGVGKTTLTWCLGDVLSTFTNAKVLLFDLDAQMSLTHAIALDSEGSSSGKFSSWYDKAVKQDRNLLAVLKNFLDKYLTSFQADNGFVFRLKENYHFVP